MAAIGFTLIAEKKSGNMYNRIKKGNGKMKNALLLLFVPIVAFAICEDCDSFRSSLLTRNQDITSEVQGMQSDAGHIIVWSSDISNSTSDSNAKNLADQIYTQASILQARSSIALEMLSSNRVDILAFNCYCSSSSGCECSGVLTNIYDRLLNIEVYARETSYGIETLLRDDLPAFMDSVSNGFENVFQYYDFVTNSFGKVVISSKGWQSFAYNETYDRYRTMSRDGVNNSTVIASSSSFRNPVNYGYLPSIWRGLAEISRMLVSLNNFYYDFSFTRFPVLTNTVGVLNRESTNFFSFFRGEVGVHGVLEDWTEQDGSYYDFLTNHYIQVVTGGTLSGNQSQKTNWFARVETLLASLVFTDSESTNTVDSSTAEQQSKEITSHFEEVNTLASNVVQDFSEKSEDIVELFRSWCQQFDSAALPSHVVLFTVPSEGEDLVIQFSLSDTPEVVAMVEGMRAITTFCWASVGIFLLYKFLVWSARCVFVACQFIYKAVSAIFK